MKKLVLIALAAGVALSGCTTTGYGTGYSYSRYDYNRPDPRYNGYYADRYYRTGPNYRERVLTRRDRIYRGQDGRYYCRRSDGTTGLIVGGVAGGVLGNIIAPGGSKVLGTLLGAAGGAAVGSAVDQGQVRCD